MPTILKNETKYPYALNGTAYTYVDSSTKQLMFMSKDITANDSPLSRTLLPLYQSNIDVTFMYNDEIPPKTHTDNQANNYGHTKGVIGFAQDEGFWLIHSCPKFPPTPLQQYSYPYSGQEMAQSFLCLTLDSKNLNQVGILQQFNHPLRYVHRITTSASSIMPDLADAMNDSFVRKKDNSTFTILDLNTRNNMRFRGYAKTENFGKELQGQLIAPDIGEDMEWQTWLQSPEDPYCPSQQSKQVYSILNISAPFDPNTYNTQSQVYNDNNNNKLRSLKQFTSIEQENINNEIDSNGFNGEYIKWWHRKDHSKWGISLGNRNNRNSNISIIQRISSLFRRKNAINSELNATLCIGDINRMASQKSRGGGAVCIQNKAVHDMLAQMIHADDRDLCKRSS